MIYTENIRECGVMRLCGVKRTPHVFEKLRITKLFHNKQVKLSTKRHDILSI